MFDWDGTLVDTLEVKIRNAGALFEETFGISHESVEAAYRRRSGLPRRQLFEGIIGELRLPALREESFQTLSQAFSERNQAAFNSMSREQLVPEDTLLALEVFSSKGYPLFVSSAAAKEEIRQVASALRIEHFFAAILGSEPAFSKGVDHLNYIRKKCNADLSQIVYIGDEPTDILLGREAGVLTVGKAGTYSPERLAQAGADQVVACLQDVTPWLEIQEMTGA